MPKESEQSSPDQRPRRRIKIKWLLVKVPEITRHDSFSDQPLRWPIRKPKMKFGRHYGILVLQSVIDLD
jgi:hypothetical protein